MVRVGGATPFQRVQLRRLDAAVSAVATTGAVTPPVTRAADHRGRVRSAARH